MLELLVTGISVEAAMRAATYIMNDDLEGAEAGLGSGNSTFHRVCRRLQDACA